ncbi:MAG: DUF488 domain-containing protein [Alphaproteobacteria bacterium]|nr:DUF488 domain-containing protein [Alphaproteobacteria bacterium]
MVIQLKRAYEAPSKSDGRRILVERLWPRGMTKEKAALDDWFKDISPSPDLRKWYGHDPAKWPEFQKRYAEELAGNGQEIGRLREICEAGVVTFIFAAKDEQRNSAVVLKKYIENLT